MFIKIEIRLCTCIRPVLLLDFLKSIIHIIAPVGVFISITEVKTLEDGF